ncbi:hypothetical protein SETIT_3G371000v2 [Setaria italica]|uniref:Uncharacterized protein n=1 Tax=Setaria italica TaxID=4555 RepID=K3ZD71_SETIT|nr:hypothetical protein SETIT_3G371000v2 [Setaria italica]
MTSTFAEDDIYCSILLIGDLEDTITFDLKPSDAINVAFRCKIQHMSKVD